MFLLEVKFIMRLVAVIVWIAIALTLFSWFAPHARGADLAVGDSIAVGTGQALGVHTVARQNMGSCWIAGRVPGGSWDHAVISSGINDGGGCNALVRARVHAHVVTWILPAPINAGRGATLRAMRPGDRAVSYACAGGCSKTNFHPASYGVVAQAVRRSWGQ